MPTSVDHYEEASNAFARTWNVRPPSRLLMSHSTAFSPCTTLFPPSSFQTSLSPKPSRTSGSPSSPSTSRTRPTGWRPPHPSARPKLANPSNPSLESSTKRAPPKLPRSPPQRSARPSEAGRSLLCVAKFLCCRVFNVSPIVMLNCLKLPCFRSRPVPSSHPPKTRPFLDSKKTKSIFRF